MLAVPPRRGCVLPLRDIPNPVGVIAIIKPVTQGSRAMRQPLAKLPNRFAVQITLGLDQIFLLLLR